MKTKHITVLCVLFVLTGCGNQVPFQYDTLEAEREAAKIEVAVSEGKTSEQIAADKKRFEKATKRLDLYEDTAKKANLFYANKLACEASNNHRWVCVYRGINISKKKIKTTDALVKRYQYDRSACGCQRSADLW